MLTQGLGTPLQRRQTAKLKWQSATHSVELGATLFLAGLIGGVVCFQDLVMRGGVQDAPNFTYPEWGIYVLTSSASHQYMASAIFTGLWIVGYVITVRGARVRKWNLAWLPFSFGALIPLWACSVPYINTTELTSMAGPQWLTVCLSCSLAQLVFGRQAWLLRSHSSRKAIEGTRSGLVFLLLTLSTQSVLILLRFLDEDWKSAVNGELWALLGGAQLIIAFTAGIGERKAVERDVRFQALLDEVHGQQTRKGRLRRNTAVWRPLRTPASTSATGRFRRREAKRLARENDSSNLSNPRF